jgi:hypothetical protein
MKKVCYIIMTLIWFSASPFSVWAQMTKGTEFWLTFGQNLMYSSSSAGLQIRIVSNEFPTIGKIVFTGFDLSHPDSVITFNIPARTVFTTSLSNLQKAVSYITTPGIHNFTIHITANHPVSVYALNHGPGILNSLDATNILPVTALGTNYYHISYQPITATDWYDAYAVIATQNNTNVSHNGISVATLAKGQVYYMRAPGSDMTGVHITTNYPVAFFAISPGTYIPFGPSSGTSTFMQQLPPVNTWGKNFFVPVSHVSRNRVRVVASQNVTHISQIGGTVRTDVPGAQTNLINLQAGQFIELDIAHADSGCFIQANKPVGVCSFFANIDEDNTTFSSSQCWIPAIEQKIFGTQVASFPVGELTNQSHPFAFVCTPTNTKNSTKVSVNGASPIDLFGGTWRGHAAANMSFYVMPLNNDATTYFFTNPEGLTVLCHATWVSYYYPADFTRPDFDAAFYANNVYYQDLPDTTFCDKLVNFQASVGMGYTNPKSIKWFINNIEYVAAQNQLQWSKPFETGEYEIKMYIHFANDEVLSKLSILKVRVFWTSIKNIRR